jgi:hypothetical protein
MVVARPRVIPGLRRVGARAAARGRRQEEASEASRCAAAFARAVACGTRCQKSLTATDVLSATRRRRQRAPARLRRRRGETESGAARRAAQRAVALAHRRRSQLRRSVLSGAAPPWPPRALASPRHSPPPRRVQPRASPRLSLSLLLSRSLARARPLASASARPARGQAPPSRSAARHSNAAWRGARIGLFAAAIAAAAPAAAAARSDARRPPETAASAPRSQTCSLAHRRTWHGEAAMRARLSWGRAAWTTRRARG